MRPPISATSLSKPKRPRGNREVGVARRMPAQRRSRDLSSSMIAQCAEVPCSYFGAAPSARMAESAPSRYLLEYTDSGDLMCYRRKRFGVLILGSGQVAGWFGARGNPSLRR